MEHYNVEVWYDYKDVFGCDRTERYQAITVFADELNEAAVIRELYKIYGGHRLCIKIRDYRLER